ncbi:MAG: DNA-binding MarR family transcriptional regulator [Gammaproteobacteria bacterium]
MEQGETAFVDRHALHLQFLPSRAPLLHDYSRISYASLMDISDPTVTSFTLAFAAAWNRVEKRLDANLSAIRGISFAEYRMLHALADAPNSSASRVELARTVGLTASGVTRALRPLEKLGIVTTQKSERDARLAIASLTPAGHELREDGAGVVHDTMSRMFERTPELSSQLQPVAEFLDSLAR